MGNRDNPGIGVKFELAAAEFLRAHGLNLTRNFKIDIGVSKTRNPHSFDLGRRDPLVLVECKRRTWTEGSNSPSAKLSVWNEAMLYFLAAPQGARNILFVLKSLRGIETLAQHYIKRFEHLITSGVEFWEYDDEIDQGARIYPS